MKKLLIPFFLLILSSLVYAAPTITTVNGSTIYTYTTTGAIETFNLTGSAVANILVLGGGGAGGGGGGNAGSGGGGAGGYILQQSITLTAGTYSVNVGAGGTGVANSQGNNGGNSWLGVTYNATGGGGGGAGSSTVGLRDGKTGGSGGAAAGGGASGGNIGTGTTGQGYNGAASGAGGAGGGGGGAGGTPAATGASNVGGAGGGGNTTNLNATSICYAGGGGGSGNGGAAGTATCGGGAAGSAGSNGASATANRGAGGGAGSFAAGLKGGDGGSGIVIVQYISTTAETNMTVYAYDYYPGTSLSTFTANITYNGSTLSYSTSTGSIVTNISNSSSLRANITVSATNYFPNTYLNQLPSSDLNASLVQAQLNLEGYDFYSRQVFNFTVTAPNGRNTNNSILYVDALTNQVFTWNKTGWNDKTNNLTILALSNSTRNITRWSDSIINITNLSDAYTGSLLSSFTISSYNSTYSVNSSGGNLQDGNGSIFAMSGSSILGIESTGYYPYYAAQTIAQGMTTYSTLSLFQAQMNFVATDVLGQTVNSFTVTAPNGRNTNNSILYSTSGAKSFTFNKTGYLSDTRTFTPTAQSNSTYNFSEMFTGLVNVTAFSTIGNTSISAFTIHVINTTYSSDRTFNATAGNVSIPGVAGTYTLFFTSSGYVSTNTTITLPSNTPLYNVSIYSDPADQFNITFIDEITGSIINTTTITASFTGVRNVYNFSTNTGTIRTSSLVPDNYTITYSGSGYNQRNYYLELNEGDAPILTLYLRPTANSTVIVVKVLDQSLQNVLGAYVYENVKNSTGLNDYTVEICSTDTNGQCLMSADVSTGTYKAPTVYRYLVVYNGETVGNSGYVSVSATADAACNSLLPCLKLIVNTATNPLESYFDFPGVQYSLTNTTRNNYEFTVSDLSSKVSQICLYADLFVGVQSQRTASNCTSGSSGTLTVYSNASLGDYTKYSGWVVYNGETRLITSQDIPSTPASSTSSFFILGALGMLSVVFFAYRRFASLALVTGAGTIIILSLVSALPGIVKTFITGVTLLLLVLIVRFSE